MKQERNGHLEDRRAWRTIHKAQIRDHPATDTRTQEGYLTSDNGTLVWMHAPPLSRGVAPAEINLPLRDPVAAVHDHDGHSPALHQHDRQTRPVAPRGEDVSDLERRNWANRWTPMAQEDPRSHPFEKPAWRLRRSPMLLILGGTRQRTTHSREANP